MDEIQSQEDEFINPDILRYLFLTLKTSIYIWRSWGVHKLKLGNIDLNLPLDDFTSQIQSNSHVETLTQPNQQQTPTQQSYHEELAIFKYP